MDLSQIFVPAELQGIQDISPLPTPEEVTYWEGKEKRIFYIDYEIDDNYQLVELSKTIIQMNFNERSIPEDQLLPITIFIHCYGGDLEQSIFMADLIESSRIPITTVAMGACMSGGFIIFLAGKHRYAFKHSQCLVHSGAATLSGTAEEVKAAQQAYDKQIADLREYVLSRTTIDPKVYNKNKNKDWYLTGKELVDYHIVDKLVDNLDEVFVA